MYDVPVRLPRTIAIFITASVLAAAIAQSVDDSASALRRTRERLLADLDRMPRYTCVQTVTRRYYRPQTEGASCKALIAAYGNGRSRPTLRGWDRLRLEVAIVDGENVFSWVGAPRFESGTLEQLAGSGPLSSGDFGPFLHAIFTRALVTFQGEKRAGGRRLLAYSYEMPLERSAYMVSGDGGWTPTAYSGAFLIDPENADISSLTVHSAELPAPSCQAISEVEYGRTSIHDRLVLIPRQTRLTVIDRGGGQTQNETAYASCREYASQTRIFYDAPPATGATHDPTPAESAPSSFPAGLHFRARIVSPIDSATSAAGDPLDAVLLSSMRDKHKKILAPAGALLHVRLVGFEQRSGTFDQFQVSLQFESIELKGKTVPLRAAPHVLSVSLFKTPVWVMSQTASEDVSVFLFRKPSLHLQKFEWAWTTLPAAPDKK